MEQNKNNSNQFMDGLGFTFYDPKKDMRALGIKPISETILWDQTDTPQAPLRSKKFEEEKIRKMQLMLYDAGFLTGNHDKVVDGLMGRNTELAKNKYILSQLIKNGFLDANLKSGKSAIDGILGKKSLEALEKAKLYGYNLKSDGNLILSDLVKVGPNISRKPLDRNGEETKECAAYVNGVLLRNGINSWGSAHQINTNNGFKTLYNGYAKNNHLHDIDTSKLSRSEARSRIMGYHRNAADDLKENLDTTQLNPNHLYVTNMYYNSSPHMEEFYNEGTETPGTHTGVLYYNNNSKTWEVSHNIHRNIHNDRLRDVLGGRSNPHKYGVTAISDAGAFNNLNTEENSKEDNSQSSLFDKWLALFKTGGNLISKYEGGGTSPRKITRITWNSNNLDDSLKRNLKKFAQSLIDNQEDLQKRFDISADNYPEFARAVLGIYGKESSYGKENSNVVNVLKAARQAIGRGIMSSGLVKNNLKNRNRFIVGGPDAKFKDLVNKLVQKTASTLNTEISNPYGSIGLTLIDPETTKNPELYTKELDLLNPEDAAYATVARLKEAWDDLGSDKNRGASMYGALNVYNGGLNYPKAALKLGNNFNFEYADESNHVLPEMVVLGKRKK